MAVDPFVAKRCVFFIGDLETGSPEEHYEKFRQNLQRFGKTWRTTGSLTPPEFSAGANMPSWRVSTKSADWSVQTEYRYWDWSDIANQSRQPWNLQRIGMAFAAFADFIKSGTCWRYFRTNRQFGILFASPAILLLCSVILLWWMTTVLSNLGLPYAFPASVAIVTGLMLALVRSLLRGTVAWICQFWIFVSSLVHLKRPELALRLGEFSKDLELVLRGRKFDEILVVGHGIGVVFLPVILDRAFWGYPEFGKTGEQVSLLTLAPQLLAVGLHPDASWLIGPLSRVARDRMVYWLELQAEDDVLGFAGRNGAEILTEMKGRPVIRTVKTPTRAGPSRQTYLDAALARHRHLLEPGSERSTSDLYMICCGPFALKTYGRTPERVLEPLGRKVSAEPIP